RPPSHLPYLSLSALMSPHSYPLSLHDALPIYSPSAPTSPASSACATSARPSAPSSTSSRCRSPSSSPGSCSSRCPHRSSSSAACSSSAESGSSNGARPGWPVAWPGARSSPAPSAPRSSTPDRPRPAGRAQSALPARPVGRAGPAALSRLQSPDFDGVAVALLGEEAAALSGEVLIDGIGGDHGVEGRRALIVLRTQDPPEPLGLLLT